MTIAGSEATGGAGAQADLKTFQELGVFGIANLTCIVSFDPKDNWNHRFVPVDQQVIEDQLEATTAAYGAGSGAPSVLDTVKIGMLGSPATISTVASALAGSGFAHVVLDPVLICKGQEPGHALDTDQALKAQILPLATFVTPNHFEAESLSGLEITDIESLKAAAVRIHELSGAAVLAKGGVRLSGSDAVDVYYDGETLEVLSAPKVGEAAVSGAGCSLAAAVTAELAKGATPLEAARTAKSFVTAGIRNRVASGAPFDALWQGGPR
ncbi:hydroxymethylpyrimidine/phosphomethylpyrimidine kinase [Pseudarthrobacter sp. MM222]|uniref:hydroxymethylpyrimidine/phosphomethylpyrimidine kinase n=1 Tax=Pseudarthrobacter sp. MM222 TaxID=3018929 RepID=UPI00221E63EC|nr:hydroxymethylpyrimidine/phosphomethylpyrimidine kinase [Pseudarthrobacter sp. MM222]